MLVVVFVSVYVFFCPFCTALLFCCSYSCSSTVNNLFLNNFKECITHFNYHGLHKQKKSLLSTSIDA